MSKPYNLSFFDMDTETEAVEFLRDSIKDSSVFVGFSGGKDSIVTAELMKMAGVKHTLYYSFTGIDAPEVISFIRKYYPECVFLMPKFTFWRKLSVNVPPSDRLRWCCTVLKKERAIELPHTERVMGIRAEESVRRSGRDRINVYKKLGHNHYYPIFYWKEWQIWDFINKHKLPYPVLYDWGFDRIGCVVCPYHSEKTGRLHAKYRDRWPGYFRRWEKGISDLYDKRKSQGKKMFYPSAREFLDAWYLDDSSRWYEREEEETAQLTFNGF